MNIIRTLEDTLAYSYQKLWDIRKIAARPLWLSALFSFLLSVCGTWFKVNVVDSVTPPFLYFFVVVTLSACYGGIRGALIGTGFTTFFSISMLLFATLNGDFMWIWSLVQIALYSCLCLFLSALLYRFHKNEQRCALQYEEALKTKKEILAREKLHEDFVHMATHNLKAPVTVLKAYIQLADMKLKMAKNHDDLEAGDMLSSFREMTTKMNLQLDKLVSLINDLLESTRVKAGALNCKMVTFDLKSCLQDCVAGFSVAHPDTDLTWSLPAEPAWIEGDEVRLEQVILNLLSNAVKYSGGKARVHVSCEHLGDQVVVKVKDHGTGIRSNMLEAIFSSFVRVKSPELSKFPGLGLGLDISAEIVKAHQGEIKAERTMGEGATFQFSLPVHKVG